MLESEKITQGFIGISTRFPATARSSRRPVEMLIEVTQSERPRRFGSRTRMSSVDVAGGLTFEPIAGATRIRWSWTVSSRGPLLLLSPLIGRLGRRQERAIWTGLKVHLERLAKRPHQQCSDQCPSMIFGAEYQWREFTLQAPPK
jgi:hypothetical protein